MPLSSPRHSAVDQFFGELSPISDILQTGVTLKKRDVIKSAPLSR